MCPKWKGGYVLYTSNFSQNLDRFPSRSWYHEYYTSQIRILFHLSNPCLSEIVCPAVENGGDDLRRCGRVHFNYIIARTPLSERVKDLIYSNDRKIRNLFDTALQNLRKQVTPIVDEGYWEAVIERKTKATAATIRIIKEADSLVWSMGRVV